MRADGRKTNELRCVKIVRRYTDNAPGSVLIEAGKTRLFCTASVENKVPPFLAGSGSGWVTGEYAMLPGSTPQRKVRESARGRLEGRTQEISRLIGRALRAAIDLTGLGQHTIWIDCDVLQADGGTRTLAITGGYVALADAIQWLVDQHEIEQRARLQPVAAVSAGIVDGRPLLDLDYEEDSSADVDMNVVMARGGKFIEVQGTAEQKPFGGAELEAMLRLAKGGIRKLLRAQQAALRGGAG